MRKILITIFFVLVLHLSLLSISDAAFENVIMTTVRAQGMGDAFCSISDEPTSILINPAGLTKLKRMSLQSSYSPLFIVDNDYVHNAIVGFSSPVLFQEEKVKGAVGVSWSMLGSSKYSENIFAVSYDHQPLDFLSVAGTVKILLWSGAQTVYFNNETEGPLSKFSVSVDAGLIYRPSEAVSLGLAFSNLNQPDIASSSSKIEDHLPLGIRAGGSFSIEKTLVSFDFINKYYTFQEKAESTLCLGIEKDFSEFRFPVAIRGGVNFPNLNGTNITCGASYKNPGGALQIDYAMIISLTQATLFTNRFSFTTSFAPVQELGEEKKKREEEEAQKRLEEESKKKAGEEEVKKKEEEERRLLEQKIRKEIEEKLRLEQEEEKKRLEAEKAVREAEIEKAKLEIEKAKIEMEKMKLEMERAKAETEKKAGEEKKAKEEAEAKAAELKDKLEKLMKSMPKEVSMKETERGLALSLGSSIFFSTGKSTLFSDAFPILDKIVEIVSAYPENKIIIEGYTDSIGSRSSNLRLSTERAENVANYLIRNGIDKSRISSAGYGTDKPIASNDTKEGRAQNRRVEIVILK